MKRIELRSKILFLSAIIGVTLCLISCKGMYDDEPRVKGKSFVSFTGEAQSSIVEIVVANNRPYNGVEDWHIIDISDVKVVERIGEVFTPLATHVDTLSNGDMVIAYDWVKFRVSRRKDKVEVTATENNTGKTRSAYLRTTEFRMYTPSLFVEQAPKL